MAYLHTCTGIEGSKAAGDPGQPFLAWPGGAHLRYAGLLASLNALWFAFVYVGMDFLTARRSFRVPVHTAAELKIPFVPAMTAAYMSIYVLFILAPLVLRTRREFRALVIAMATAIFCAGIGFLLFPADLAFPQPSEQELGIWASLFHLADTLNLTYNLLPSLHVTLAVICVAVFSSRAAMLSKTLLWLWAGIIAASTVLIHQHHLLDVATGWLLALLCFRYCFQSLANHASSREVRPA